MSRARLDLEKDKFDSEGRVKVSIEANNSTAQDQDVVVKNTSSEPVPVSIVNPDANIDLQVEIQPNITIDDSTPIDTNVTNTSLDVNITALDGDGDLGVKVQNTTDINVNVTNTSLNTNATIQNANLDVNLTDLDINSRLPVSVDNQPTVTVDDSTPINTNITNASINTNATIQGTPSVSVTGDVSIDDATAIRVDVTNTEVDVNVTNPFQYVYDMVYDGSQWRFQLSDTNGKAINLDHTYYTSTEITALGSSTDLNLWLAAYNDSMLQYKYVGSYDDEFEVEVYLTHPSLGDGNKCLKLIFDYSTQNTKKVVQSVYASVVDWNFDSSVTGALTLTLGTITSPDPNSAIPIGTDICTISVTNTGQGTITLELSGTNASLYTLRNVTDGVTGSSLAYDSADSYVLELASDISGASYSHSLTITASNDFYGNTDSENVATSGTYSATPSWSNSEYVTGGVNYNTATKVGLYFKSNPTNNEGWFPTQDGQNNLFYTQHDSTISFWYKGVTNQNYITPWYQMYAANDTSIMGGIEIWLGASKIFVLTTGHSSNTSDRSFSSWSLSNMTDWTHICIVIPTSTTSTGAVTSATVYIDGTSLGTTSPTVTSANITETNIVRFGITGAAPQYTTTNTNWATYGGSDSVSIDEVSTWRKGFSQSEVWELAGLNTSDGSGTATPTDSEAHSAATGGTNYLERYVRCGDLSGDGTVLKDALDTGFELIGNSGNDYTTAY